MYAYMAAMTPGLLSDIALDIRSKDEINLTVSGQQRTKPDIDDVICHYLDGSTLKDALNFINYVRASKMKIKWSAVNVWSVRYKNQRVLDMIVENGSWRVRLVFDHMSENRAFSKRDAEVVKSIIGELKNLAPTTQSPIPAMS